MTPVQVWLERLLICGAASVYLVAFNQTQPHGDALRIVRQIEARDLIWNPNHLVFDPLGYGLYFFLNHWFPSITPLGCFEMISAAATVGSLLIFHAILVRAGVTHAALRVFTVVGLFASASFISVAVSQYYFMVQMPLLLAALYLYLDFVIGQRTGDASVANLHWMGVLLALATAVMFNNLLLVGASGIAVSLMRKSLRHFEWRNALRLYVAAAAVGFPIFIVGYLLADASSNPLDWLLAYQGDTSSQLNQLYGIKWSPADVIRSAAMTGYNLLVDSIVNPASLGTVLDNLVFRRTFEFIPQWDRITLGIIAFPAVIAMNFVVAVFTFRHFGSQPVVRFLAFWILAFVVFNFLWSAGDNIFWIQLGPAVWILLILSQHGMSMPLLAGPTHGLKQPTDNWRPLVLGLFVALLLVVNTTNAVAPGAARDYQSKQLQHAALLRDGDLVISTGWDQQKWMMLPGASPNVEKLVLMNIAVAAMGSDRQMIHLPDVVRSRLSRGHRVIVARVFDLDRDPMPWSSLRDIGWSRDRIRSLFAPFCNRVIGVIDDVVFREVYHCDRTQDSPLPETDSGSS